MQVTDPSYLLHKPHERNCHDFELHTNYYSSFDSLSPVHSHSFFDIGENSKDEYWWSTSEKEKDGVKAPVVCVSNPIAGKWELQDAVSFQENE